MLDSLRKTVAIPQVSARLWLPALSLTVFGTLLVHDVIHPAVIFLLQLYLAF
jgi:hypothetical protein